MAQKRISLFTNPFLFVFSQYHVKNYRLPLFNPSQFWLKKISAALTKHVEIQEQMVFLEDRGCDCAHGFLLHKPVKFEDLKEWILKKGVFS